MLFSSTEAEMAFIKSVVSIAHALTAIGEVASESHAYSEAEREEYDLAQCRRQDDDPRRRADDPEREQPPSTDFEPDRDE